VDRYSVFSLSGPDAFYFGIESEPEAKDDSDVTDTDVPSSPSQVKKPEILLRLVNVCSMLSS